MGSSASSTGKRILSKSKPSTIIQPSTKPDVNAPSTSTTSRASDIDNTSSSDGDLVKNMNELMDLNRIPFKATTSAASSFPGIKTKLTDHEYDPASGRSKALFDAQDPTAPSIQKSFVKDNLALNILESRKRMVEEKEEKEESSKPYKLSTASLIELLRTTRQDPEIFKEAAKVNEKNNITHLRNHEQETDTLREFYNVPELSIRENEDGTINGHWVDDLHEFNKIRAKNA